MCGQNYSCLEVAFNTDFKSHKPSITSSKALFRSIDRSLHPKGCKPSIFLRLWEFLPVRDAGVAKSLEHTSDLGYQRLLCHWRFDNQHFYTVYIQKDLIWIVLGSLDDYFCCGLHLFSTYMYMDKKQYSTFVNRMRAIAKS